MKAALKLGWIVLILGLAGCSFVTAPAGIPVSASLSKEAQAVQTTINEANILLNAAAQVIGQNKADGITTQEVARGQLQQVRDFAKEVDKAQAMLDMGDILGAKNKAELTARLITALHKRVAEQARAK